MILILDDTENLCDRFNIDYIFDRKYNQYCKLIDKPYAKRIMELSKDLSEFQLLCHHRSLNILKDEESNLTDENILMMKESFIKFVDDKKIDRIEFGRDMHTNFLSKTIDKELFYKNFKPFIDFYILKNSIELKILYYGENYKEMEKMTLIDKVIDEIRKLENLDFQSSQLILDGLNFLFPDENPRNVIENWNKRELSKKEIIQTLNDKL